jgi:acyl-CoA thioesterase-1
METPMYVRYAVPCLLALTLSAGCSRGQEPSAGSAQPAPSASTAAAVTTPAAARPRVVFLGDSLTAGFGLPASQAFPVLIGEKLRKEGLDAEVVNAGISGDTAAGGRRRLTWALEGDVRVLVLALGANDGLRGNPVTAMKADLEAIIRAAKARGITVLLLGMEAPPNFGPEYTAEFRQAFRDLAKDEDVAFVPFFLDGVAGVPALNQGDGLHPNARGVAAIVDRITPYVVRLVQGEKRG